jgi:hypothetical protein
MGECRRCYNDKTDPKKFSTENNMNPGDLPKELQGLTEIEEMLIAQIFPIISVYCLRGGQYSYRGNVITSGSFGPAFKVLTNAMCCSTPKSVEQQTLCQLTPFKNALINTF